MAAPRECHLSSVLHTFCIVCILRHVLLPWTAFQANLRFPASLKHL